MAHAHGYLSFRCRAGSPDPAALDLRVQSAGSGDPALQQSMPTKITRLHFLSALCALLGFAPFASAQPNLQAVRFTVFSAKPIEGLGFVPRAGVAPAPLAFSPTARSPRYDYRGPMPLRFVDAESGVVVAEATIPIGLNDALLLFSPLAATDAGGGKLRYQVSVLDDGAARHGSGGLAIINLSGLSLSGTVNKEAVTLQPGLNSTLKVGTFAKIALQTQVRGRTFQAYAGSAALKPAERALLILFPPFYKGSPEVQARLLLDSPPGATPAVKKEAKESVKR